MKNDTHIVITGVSGFIGKHLVRFLKNRYGADITITAAGRSRDSLANLCSQYGLKYAVCDISEPRTDWFELLGRPDILIHLAWGHLDNFKDSAHVTEELPNHTAFLTSMITSGLASLTAVGTCLEYGLQQGELREDASLLPVTPYGEAKAQLFKILAESAPQSSCSFKWLRYFYMYGEGQNPRSLLPLLDKAISSGEAVFNMSGGEQLRDYLPVEKIAEYTALAALQDQVTGAVNICSGTPISVRELVLKRILERNSSLQLNTGFYPYPDYEPMAFWGNRDKLQKIVEAV